jgi:hypothetical protein
MCGAAAESILLALAIAKTGDEAEVLKTYNSRSGRSSLVRILTGQVAEPVRRRFTTYSELLNYWRDDAAHGVASDMSDAHAEESLATLLRLAQFSADHLSDLTGRDKPVPDVPSPMRKFEGCVGLRWEADGGSGEAIEHGG